MKDIANRLYEDGFRSNQKGGKVHASKIHLILNNPFYYGVMVFHRKHYAGKHEPIIDKALFDRCRAVTEGIRKPKNKKHLFVYRGLCKCAECGCSITAEKQKGISYYHCTNGKGICSQKSKYIREDQLESQLIFKVFNSMNFDNSVFDQVLKKTFVRLDKLKNIHEEVRNNLESQVTKLQGKKDRLMDVYLNQRIADKDFDRRCLEIENEITSVKHQLEYLPKGTNTNDTFEQAQKALKDFMHNKKHYLEMTNKQKRETIFLLLSNFTLKDRKIVNLQYHPPFHIISKPPQNVTFSLLSDW